MGVPILEVLDSGKLDVPASTTLTENVRPVVNELWTLKFLIVHIELDVNPTGGDLARFRLNLIDDAGGADDIIIDTEEITTGTAEFHKQYGAVPSAVTVAQPIPIGNMTLDNDHYLQMYGETETADSVILNWLLTGLKRPLP